MIGHRITGRLPGVSINKEGEEQARRLVRLSADAIVSSPMERTIQTATPLAEHLGLQIQADEAFVEVDFGSWSGLTLTELDAIPEWKIFNQFRSSFRLPGGEMMLEVQRRVVEGLARHAAANSGKIVAVFSHADVIRAGRVALHRRSVGLDASVRDSSGLGHANSALRCGSENFRRERTCLKRRRRRKPIVCATVP